MNIIKYFIYHFHLLIYAIASAIFSLLVATITNNFNIEAILRLFLVALILSNIMRIADDIYDYAKDRRARKKQYLTKRELIILQICLFVIFMAFNVLFYGAIGLLSLLLLGVVIIWERLQFCKIIFMSLCCAVYSYLLGGQVVFRHYGIWCCITLTLIISVSLYIYKARKEKNANLHGKR